MAEPLDHSSLAALKRAYDGRFDDVSAAVLVVVPPAGRIVSVNLEAEELTGYERAELEAMTLADIFRDEDRQRIGSIFESTTQEFRKLFEHNVIVRKRSRRKIIVDMGFRRSRQGDAFVFTLQDITDLKLNEERVLRAHEYVNSIINSIVEVLLVVSDNGEIQTVNAAALHLLGYREEELVGQALSRLLPDGAGPHVLTVGAGSALAEVETQLKAKDGSLLPVLASKSDLKSRRDGGARAVIVAMDISERKKAERLIAEQQMMIVQASKMSALGEMASSIAHEINNPLQVILGRCELLEVQAADPAAQQDLLASVGLIDRMSQRIHKIIHGLQALARDQRHDPMEDADLRDILSETLALCEQRIRTRVQRFEVPALADALILHCRPTQISQVLLNLLNNSYDEVGGESGAWIRLEVALAGAALTLTVTDSGKGIPPDVAERMFAPFFTTKPVGKGTGIGLSVSRSLIEAHGGVLELDRASPDTRFVIRLPLAQAAARRQAG